MAKAKPKILKEKIVLAGLLKRYCIALEYFRRERGYCWSGVYMVGGRKLYVYFQRYVRRQEVDMVRLAWVDTTKALTPTEIREITKKIVA